MANVLGGGGGGNRHRGDDDRSVQANPMRRYFKELVPNMSVDPKLEADLKVINFLRKSKCVEDQEFGVYLDLEPEMDNQREDVVALVNRLRKAYTNMAICRRGKLQFELKKGCETKAGRKEYASFDHQLEYYMRLVQTIQEEIAGLDGVFPALPDVFNTPAEVGRLKK